mgnify:CR=1 FL=1
MGWPGISLTPFDESTARAHMALAAKVALWILVMRAVEIAWMVAPMVRHGDHNGPSWVDFAAVLGVGVVWLPLFFRNLGSQPVVPVHDPYLKDAIHGGH